uniref:FAR1 domain-containing protein n=1 Tax=Arundo donax TaxID=35708 RepID=A0A0A9FM91_ARUDO
MCGCPACLHVLRNKDGKYYVKTFVSDHNHELVKSLEEKRLLHSYQSIDQSTMEMVRYLRENNVSLSKVRCVIGSMHGSMDNLTFSKKHLKIVCSSIAAELLAHDIQKTLQSLMHMRDQDPNITYSL